MKIFVIGFNKTGTTSLHKIFVDWGFASIHALYSDWSPGDSRFDEFECFLDGERHDFRGLDARYEEAKFILLSRRLDDWLISRIRHTEIRRAKGKTGVMRQEYEAEPGKAVRNWIKRREEYYQDAFDYFSDKRKKLLPLNVCDCNDGQSELERLAGFLGLRLEDVEHRHIPHVREGDKAAKVVRGRFRWLFDRRSRVRPKNVVREEVTTALRRLGWKEDEWGDDGLEPFRHMQRQVVANTGSVGKK